MTLGDTGLSDGTGIPYSQGQKTALPQIMKRLTKRRQKNLPKKENDKVGDNLLGSESCAWLFWAPYQYWSQYVIDIEQNRRYFRQI